MGRDNTRSTYNINTMSDNQEKHYMVRGCNRRISIDGKDFPFEPYLLEAGQWLGMYSTSNEDEQKILDDATWIHELSDSDRESELKKKHPDFQHYNPLPSNPEPYTRTTDAPPAPKETESSTAEDEPEDLELDEIITPSPVKGSKPSKKSK